MTGEETGKRQRDTLKALYLLGGKATAREVADKMGISKELANTRLWNLKRRGLLVWREEVIPPVILRYGSIKEKKIKVYAISERHRKEHLMKVMFPEKFDK